MTNDYHRYYELILWLEHNEVKIDPVDIDDSALTLRMPFDIDGEQTIQVGASGWVTRVTKWIDATIYSTKVVIDRQEK